MAATGVAMTNGKPVSVDKALRRAKSLIRKGETDAAREVYQEIFERFPQNARALEGIAALDRPSVRKRGGFTADKAERALALYHESKYPEALPLAAALVDAFPDTAFVHNLKGLILDNLVEREEAEACFLRALELDPDYGDAHCNLGELLNRLGRSTEAIPHLEKAIAVMKDPAVPYNNLGSAYSHLGQFEEAARAYERAIEARPKFAAAHRNLSMVKRYTENDPQIAQMGVMLQNKEVGVGDQAHLSFALAKACEDIGKDSHAFDLLAHGNRLQRSISNFSIEKERRVFAKIKTLFEDPPEPLPVPAGDGPRPIFVLGMPRSGTSLAEQILASHSQVHGAGELMAFGRTVVPFFNRDRNTVDRSDYETIRATYLDVLKGLGQPDANIVDKLPLNFRWIGYILGALPEAKIIHTRRNPVAVGWSIYKIYFPAGGMSFSWDLTDIAGYLDLYEDLMAFWHEKYPGRIHDLQYEDLTENQEEETRKLIAACGLEWEDACLQFHKSDRAVATASATQIRRKMYTGSSEAWRKYEDRLQPLLKRAG